MTLDQFLAAIRQQESGGNYNVVNGIGATGAYQVMPANIGPWTQQALGRRMTQAEFRASPAAQDAVARTILGGYFQKYGPEGAAAMWYSGQPNPNSSASSPGAPTVRQYVNQVMSRVGTAGTVSNTGDLTIPVPGTDGLSIPNPFDLGGSIASSVAGAIWSQVQPFALTALFALGGLSLVVMGMFVTSQPIRDASKQKQDQIASLAMKAV